MEPRVSLSWYVIAQLVGITGLSLAGHADAGLWISVGVAVFAALLNAMYLMQRSRAGLDEFAERRNYDGAPEHRRKLDQWTLAQWLALLVIGVAISLGLKQASADPFEDTGFLYDVIVIGWVTLWAGVYMSSLVDWFLILQKVSGISCPAPCELAGEERWTGLTGLWAFHRGMARLLVPAVLVGCPTITAAISDDGTVQAIGVTLAGILTILLAHFELEGKQALAFGLKARRHLGDVIWLVEERGDDVLRQPVYTMDISAEGVSCKRMDREPVANGERPSFSPKHQDWNLMSLEEFAERPRVPGATSPCRDGCCGINWYCWNNPRAHSQTTGN